MTGETDRRRLNGPESESKCLTQMTASANYTINYIFLKSVPREGRTL